MNRYYRKKLLIFFLLAGYMAAFSQSPSFYHLTTQNGLRDNHIRSLAIDNKGFLWIGTEEGLNVYDGRSVSVFVKEKHGALPSDIITQLFCDAQTRLWIGTNQGAAWIDQQRVVHAVSLPDTIHSFATRAFIQTSGKGIILFTSRGQFAFQNNEWQRLQEASLQLPTDKIKAVESYDDNRIIVLNDSAVALFNYQNKASKRRFSLRELPAFVD